MSAADEVKREAVTRWRSMSDEIGMYEQPDGEWVSFEDFATVTAERDALREEVERKDAALRAIGRAAIHAHANGPQLGEMLRFHIVHRDFLYTYNDLSTGAVYVKLEDAEAAIEKQRAALEPKR